MNDNLLDSNQLVRVFGVTLCTIFNWRRQLGLPAVRVRTTRGMVRPRVRFRAKDVERWAKRNGKIPVLPIHSVLPYRENHRARLSAR